MGVHGRVHGQTLLPNIWLSEILKSEYQSARGNIQGNTNNWMATPQSSAATGNEIWVWVKQGQWKVPVASHRTRPCLSETLGQGSFRKVHSLPQDHVKFKTSKFKIKASQSCILWCASTRQLTADHQFVMLSIFGYHCTNRFVKFHKAYHLKLLLELFWVRSFRLLNDCSPSPEVARFSFVPEISRQHRTNSLW